MLKISPNELTFDAQWDDDMGMTAVFIATKDEDHELSDNLRQDNVDALPEYFLGEDAENFWYVEVPVEQVANDLTLAGFTKA